MALFVFSQLNLHFSQSQLLILVNALFIFPSYKILIHLEICTQLYKSLLCCIKPILKIRTGNEWLAIFSVLQFDIPV
jgi:hypothetical protein